MARTERERKPKIGIIGGGSWATALVKILTDNSNTVRWWMRNPETIKHIKAYHRNPNYLSYLELNLKKCRLSDKLKKILTLSDIVVVAVPAAFIKEVFQKVKPRQLQNKIIISATKGMIPDDNLIIGDYFEEHFKIDPKKFVVLSGPCHAEEVALEKLSYITISCPNEALATRITGYFNCRYIKATSSDDIHGTEYAAVLKNIVAVACGICHGLGYGDNFQAVLVSNAIQEIKRFVDTVHPIKRDIKASAYLGDLLVTAYSQFSRNRTFGNMIGKGYSVKSAQFEMTMIAEGYYAVKCIHEVNKKYKVEMPITDAVYNMLYEKTAPMVEIRLLTEKLK